MWVRIREEGGDVGEDKGGEVLWVRIRGTIITLHRVLTHKRTG